jgi:hypothetical protein
LESWRAEDVYVFGSVRKGLSNEFGSILGLCIRKMWVENCLLLDWKAVSINTNQQPALGLRVGKLLAQCKKV